MSYSKKSLIKSFRVPEGMGTKAQVELACERLLQEERKSATSEGLLCDLSYEVVETMGSVRVNLYDATDLDAVMFGHHLAMIRISGMKM